MISISRHLGDDRFDFIDVGYRWLDPLEDLVLHDATKDIRTPTHELTIARDVLRTRRRIAGQFPDWAFSADGIRSLRKTSEIGSGGGDEATTAGVIRAAVAIGAEGEGEGDDGDDVKDLPGVDYAAIDAILARSDGTHPRLAALRTFCESVVLSLWTGISCIRACRNSDAPINRCIERIHVHMDDFTPLNGFIHCRSPSTAA